MAKRLPRVRGERLQARFDAIRNEPVCSPDWRTITPRALGIGAIMIITELLPIAWAGHVILVRDGLLLFAGYLLCENLRLLRDRSLWRIKPPLRTAKGE